MPNYKGHVCVGIASYAALMYFIKPAVSMLTMIEWFFCMIAGSLFPDVDIKSKGQKYFYRGMVFLFLYIAFRGSFCGLLLCGSVSFLPVLVRHRGIFHSITFMLIIALGAGFIAGFCTQTMFMPLWYDIVFFVMGAIVHIVADRCYTHFKKSRLFK
jgi:LexA-binding, inner membrane-associated putative hydrolase